ncbi:tRNA (guanosine(37)-N1)-methyltransferase TrmD [Comamonadaceae bacterium M7527]|nr:tRNA (guanosine(37)-N1)-methyltransferase TrmD [Comamonadaceae bacterium M7527]
MRLDIITLFPELFAPTTAHGINRRAFESGQVDVRLWQLRDFASGNYRRVDDRPFGGGPGMVMLAEPLFAALQAIRADRGLAALDPQAGDSPVQDLPVVLFSPQGQRIRHDLVASWAQPAADAVWVCGRYEGVDQRFVDRYVTHQLSLGDFVLSGGELAAIPLLDAIARLQPGVLSDEQSHLQDSFNPSIDGLLDCDHYTRPEEWQGLRPPEVLLQGNHQAIAQYRREASLQATASKRPDVLAVVDAAGLLSKADKRFVNGL